MEKNKTNYVAVILVGLLLVFSVVQAIEINDIKDEVSIGNVKSPVKTISSAGVQAQAPSMVGDC
jgi:hypothetical protein